MIMEMTEPQVKQPGHLVIIGIMTIAEVINQR